MTHWEVKVISGDVLSFRRGAKRWNFLSLSLSLSLSHCESRKKEAALETCRAARQRCRFCFAKALCHLKIRRHLFNQARLLNASLRFYRTVRLASSTRLAEYSSAGLPLRHVSLRCCLVTNASLCIIRGPTIPGVTWRKLGPAPKLLLADAVTFPRANDISSLKFPA